MEQTTGGDHHQIKFESFAEYLDYQESHQGSGYFTMPINEAVGIARKGLTTEGLKALEVASELLPALDASLIDTRFKPVACVDGADVNISDYLAGEPECMVTYECVDQENVQPIVTIVVATGILGRVSGKAIAERGARAMALLQAIEYAGVQTEIWSDSSTHGYSRGTGAAKLFGRISVRLKRAGEPFDAGTLMYCMTHESMHRTLGFNTKDHFPKRFAAAMNKSSGYGSTVLDEDMKYPEDYPDGAVYISALRDNSDTLNVEDTLKRLGLTD